MTAVRLLCALLFACASLAAAASGSPALPQTAVASEPPPATAAGAHTSIPSLPLQHRQALPSSFRLNPDSDQPPSDPYLSVLIFLLVIQCGYWMLRYYPQLRRFVRRLLPRPRRGLQLRRPARPRRPAALSTPPR